MFKKSLALVLSLLMVLSVVIALPAFAEDAVECAHDYSTAGQCKVCGYYEYIKFKPGNTTAFYVSSTQNASITTVVPAYSSETGRIEAPTGGIVDVIGNMDKEKMYAPITISFDLTVNEVLLNNTSKSLPYPILNLRANESSTTTQELLALGATEAGADTVEVMFFATPDRALTGSDHTKGINDSSIYTMTVGETYSFFVLVDPVTLKESVYINGEYAGSASLDSTKIATSFTQNYKFRFGQQTVQSRYFFNYSLDNVDAALYSSISDAYAALPGNQIVSMRFDRWQSGFGYGSRPVLSQGATTYIGSFSNMLPSSTATADDGTVYATMSGSGAERSMALSTTSGTDTFNLAGKKYEIRVDFALAAATGSAGDIVRLYRVGDSTIRRLVSYSNKGTLEAHSKGLYDKEGNALSFLTTVTNGIPESTTDLRIVVDEANATYSIYVNGTVAYWRNGNHFDPFIDMPLSDAKSMAASTTPAYDYMRLFAGSIPAILKEASVTLIPDDEIEFIGSQSRNSDNGAANGTFDLRFVYGVDNLYMGGICFEIEAYKNGEKIGDTQDLILSTVFKALKSGDSKLQAYECSEGEYLAAFKIIGIEETTEADTYSFKITPYTVNADNEKVLRESTTVEYDGLGQIKKN